MVGTKEVGRGTTKKNLTSNLHATGDKSRELECNQFGRYQAQTKQPEERSGVCH
jgi:hypothetical protein